MRHVRPVLAVAAVVLGCGAAPAWAQTIGNGSSVLVGVSGARPVAETDIAVRVKGRVLVTFHGDHAAGCDALGVCDYSGAVSWVPGSGGDLLIVAFRRHRRLSYQGLLALGLAGPPSSTAAHVRSADGGTCADSVHNTEGPRIFFSSARSTISLAGPGSTLLSTRCAGPAAGDVAGAAPVAAVSVKALLGGHRSIDLGGTSSFSGRGFSGTVSSTVALSLGRARRAGTKVKFPPGIKLERLREVTEALTAVRAAGTLNLGVTTSSNPALCEPLDACGLSGELGLSPLIGSGRGSLFASGPARRPYVDFLKALGLSRRGNARGISVGGGLSWNDRGALVESIGTCTDAVPLGSGGLGLVGNGGALTVSYEQQQLRTRCPGPFAPGSAAIAAASVPSGSLSTRSFVVQLRGGRSFTDAAYRVAVSGDVSITIRRGAISRRTMEVPVG